MRLGPSRNLRIPEHILLISSVLVAGCALGGGSLAVPSMTHAEQEAAILKVVPEGTPREQAVEKLQQAGIQGGFGISESIYYCDAWRRRGGNVSHLDVALLFDEQGKLYATRRADSAVQVERAPSGKPQVSASANEPSESETADRLEKSASPSTTPSVRQDSTNPFAAEEF